MIHWLGLLGAVVLPLQSAGFQLTFGPWWEPRTGGQLSMVLKQPFPDPGTLLDRH